MLTKIFMAAGIVILFLWAVAMTYTTIWLFRNFQEYREISKHNDTTFKDVITAHSSEIGGIKEAMKNTSAATDEIVKNIDERINKQGIAMDSMKTNITANEAAITAYQRQLSEVNSKVSEQSYKLSGMEVAINTISRLK